MTVNRFKKMFTYNYWANDKVWACIEALSEEQFTRPCDYSVGSLHEQVVHMMYAEELWLERIRDGETALDYGSASHFPTRTQIEEHWGKVKQDWLAYLDTLTEDDLAQTISFNSLTYKTIVSNERWEGLMQVLNHATDHRAQILSLIHQVGGDTLAQDLVFYVWGK